MAGRSEGRMGGRTIYLGRGQANTGPGARPNSIVRGVVRHGWTRVLLVAMLCVRDIAATHRATYSAVRHSVSGLLASPSWLRCRSRCSPPQNVSISMEQHSTSICEGFHVIRTSIHGTPILNANTAQ